MTNDETNTWRALKDLAPVASSWLCALNLHKWTKWSEPFYAGYYHHQIKECVHCNIKQTQKVSEQVAAGCGIKI